jgi:hypothetical protein
MLTFYKLFIRPRMQYLIFQEKRAHMDSSCRLPQIVYRHIFNRGASGILLEQKMHMHFMFLYMLRWFIYVYTLCDA